MPKRAHGVGMQGTTGTWGVVRGRQDIKHRDGQWRPAGVDDCTGGQAVQDWKRGENRVQGEVQLSQRVADGEGIGKRRVTEMIEKIVETVGRG